MRVYASYGYFADGNEGNPAYTFANDTDTGIWRSDVNVLSFSTGGDEKFRIDAGGVSRFYGSVNHQTNSIYDVGSGGSDWTDTGIHLNHATPTVIMKATTANADYAGVIRMAEENYQGMVIWYDGSQNAGKIGMHPTSNTVQDSSNDIYAMKIIRNTRVVEFASTVKIEGGSPGADKVLTSDASGNATWEDASGGGGLSWSSFVSI